MDQISNQIYSTIKIENNLQIIDIDTDLDTYDLLSVLFHKETMVVDSSTVFSIVKNDKRRYFEDTTVCYKCGEIGHISRDCSLVIERNCMYCDINHKGRSCDFLFCDNCLRLGHTSRYCNTRQFQPINCGQCPSQNHYEEECPRIWRRYNLKNLKPSKNLIMSCPLCFSSNHFIDDCEERNRTFTIFTKDYIKLLEKPRNMSKRPTKD